MKIILDIGKVLSGKLKIMDTMTMQEQVITFARNEASSKVQSVLQLEILRCSSIKKKFTRCRAI